MTVDIYPRYNRIMKYPVCRINAKSVYIRKILSKLYVMEVLKEQVSDQQLFSQMKAGGHQAFTTLYHRYKHRLYRHALQKVGNADEVDDIIQDLFSTMWTQREKINIHTSFETYLFKALRNRIIDYYLKGQNRKKYEALVDFYAHSLNETDYRIREKLYSAKVKNMIAHFPERTKAIFQMRVFEDVDNQQIAKRLGLSEKTVRNNIWMVMKYLRDHLTLSSFILFFFGTM